MRARASAVSAALLVLAAACAEPRRDAPRPGARVPAPSRIDSLVRLGDSTYRQSPDSARRLWSLALADARAVGDSANIARALTGLGQAARQLGDLAAARQHGEEALALKLRLDLRAELFRSYNALGLLAWNEERLADASTLFARAEQAARRTGDSVALVKSMVNAGLVAMDRGAFTRARDAFVGARDAARAGGDSVTLARALNNLAALDIAMGDPIGAIASIETARRIARAVGDSTVEVNARGQLATAYDALGEPQRAFALLDSGLAMARRGGQRQEVVDNLKLIADLFLDAGDHEHALDYYRHALVVSDSLGQAEARGNILRNQARAHAALGNVSLAAQLAGRALGLHQAAGVPYPQLADRIVLAALAQRGGRNADAESHLRAARRLVDSLDAPVAGARLAIAEAQVAAHAGQWPRVLRVLDASRASLGLAGSGAEAEAFTLRARAHASLGQLDAALAAGRRAITAVERVRGSYASGELRTAYGSDKAAVYAEQALLLLRAGRAEEAFEVADAARGRALLEHLGTARADLRGSATGAGLLAREALLRRIDALVARLERREARPSGERSPAFATATTELRDSVLAARAEYEALVARDATVRARPTVLAAPSLPEVRRSLRPDEVLLEYLVTPERVLIFAVRSSGVRTFAVDERATDLAARVQLTRALLQQRDRDDAARGVLRALHGVLLGPVAASGALRGASRLIVVPHGALTYLPFAALVDPATDRFVADDLAVLHLPTSASLPVLRGASATRDAGVRQTGEVFAPFPDSLPATRDEAASVGRAFRTAVVRVGAGATEAQLRRALTRSAIVHVATHARLNGRNPLFSHLALAGTRSAAPADNGSLEVHELLGLRLDTPLVFLSGCETALGAAWTTRFETGEDYTTIAQTLLYAGARNVVATLWRIDDAGAAEFAKRFYAAPPGTPVPEALAEAQRAMRAHPRYRSPYYWAAYQAIGGGTTADAGARLARLSDGR